MGYRVRNNNYPEPCHEEQRHDHEEQKHVHELQGSVKIAEEDEDAHNHRFCTVTEEAKPLGPDDHFHEVCFRTDFFDEHYHEFKGRTCGAIPVGDRHVHFIESVTTENDDHRHAFEAATLIENPIGENHRKKDHCDKEERYMNNYRR